MPDSPASLVEFQRQFPDDDACAAWLVTARWPFGFRCPACGSAKGWPHGGKPFTFECAACGKQKSAWLLCGKLRRAMVAPRRAPLASLIEVDETEIPLRTKADPVCGGGGRSPEGKMLVAGGLEVENDACGRLRLAVIKDFSAASLHGFVAANVAPGATIKTDGWPSYAGAPDVRHEPHVVDGMAAHVVLPWVHRAFSNAKTWARHPRWS